MQTINTYYEDFMSLKRYVINHSDLLWATSNRAVLVQVFAGICDKNYLIAISKQIRELIPGAQVIGTTTNGEIMNGLVSGLKTVLSFSVFYHSDIKVACANMKDGNAYGLGRSIVTLLNRDKAKVLILFATGQTVNASQLLKGIQSVNAGLPVAGGSAGDNLTNTKCFVFGNEDITECGAVGVIIESDSLTVTCHNHLCWQPIGKEMTITRAEGSRVYTIDNMPAFQVYRRYLGIDENADIYNVVEFPLAICKHGIEISRSPFLRHDDDSLSFFSDMDEGDKVRFSFGHVEMILEKVDTLLQTIKKQSVESIFVYSCASRRGFLQDSTQIETMPLQSVAPTAGFFTSGEYFHADNSNQLLNTTMTTLALSESGVTKGVTITDPEKCSGELYGNLAATKDNVADRSIEVLKALAHLINIVTSELNERTTELETANQIIKEREERLTLVLDGSTDGFWDWNLDTDRVYRSGRLLDILGYSQKEIEPNLHTWQKLIHPDDLNPTVKALSDYLEGRKSKYEAEYRLLTESGELKWIFERGSVVARNENGKPLRLAGTCSDITDRKRMEEALSLSEDKFSKAFNCNPDPITITTVDEGRYVEINDAWLEYTGYQRDEAINHTSTELFLWTIPGERERIIKQIQEHGKIRNMEVKFNVKSGEMRTVLLSAEKIDMGGDPHLLIITKDITDLKRTENQLQEERNFNAALLDTAGDLIAVCDTEGRIVLFNKRCEQITGHNINEVKNRYIWEIVHSHEDTDNSKALFDKRNCEWKTPGIKQRFENHWITKDGKRRLISWTITGLVDEKGQISHAIGTGIDITDQRIMEERLRESEAKLRSIYENANGIIYTLSTDGVFGYVSRGWTEVLGHDLSQVEGQSFEPFLHPDDVLLFKKFLKKVLTTGEPQKEVEYRVKHINGSWRWHTSSGAPVKDEAGNTLNYVGIAFDVTERKQAEEDIKYLSYHDKLTGLYNRTFFEEELKHINTSGQLPIGLIIGDVNGLKLINDALGHQEGDKVLVKAAEILRNSCRQEDIISRWGGDEFIILLPRCDSAGTLRVFKRIYNSFISLDSLPIPINISLGMAIQTSLDQNIRYIIREAEEKMYRNKLLESRSTRSSFIKSLEKTLWEKSHETKEHCQRLQEMAQKMGRALDLTDSELDNLKLLAALHDIGKIAIPNSILDKPGKLTPEEWETIKNHPEIGYRIALSSPELAPIAEAILHHHESWDGTGYPLRIKGEKIPLISRIIAITDTYDVMINGRPYKKAVSKEEALAEIQRCAGTQFDPELVRKGLFFD